MKSSQAAMLALLRILATLMTLSWLVGILVVAVGMGVCLNANGDVATKGMVSFCLRAMSYTFPLFVVGVFLHWILAKRTGVFPRGARQALFWSSLLMCALFFPFGLIPGGVTLWLLVASDVFKVKEEAG